MTSRSGEKKATEGREQDRERWSAQRKAEIVLRLLRGEDPVEVSREIKVPPPTLEEWRRIFLERGQQGLKARSRDPAEEELIRTRGRFFTPIPPCSGHTASLEAGFPDRSTHSDQKEHKPRNLELVPLTRKKGVVLLLPVCCQTAQNRGRIG